MDKVGSLFWNSSVFLPKGVSTEILNVESVCGEDQRAFSRYVGVSLAGSVACSSPGHGFVPGIN